ncbi:MAG: LysM peptidoglycan-binding domain-containing protein [Chloroflexi bacterium]|nr:MAG: LysM peptidoglycan-binding domain-containing protein [Chloroflexota bacterium]
MYAAGHGIKPWRAPRAGGLRARRAVVVAGAVVAISLGLAVAAHGGTAPAFTTVVVQPGDTLWGIASEHYPADDVRARVQDIEQANGLRGPTIEVGQSLRLPG